MADAQRPRPAPENEVAAGRDADAREPDDARASGWWSSRRSISGATCSCRSCSRCCSPSCSRPSSISCAGCGSGGCRRSSSRCSSRSASSARSAAVIGLQVARARERPAALRARRSGTRSSGLRDGVARPPAELDAAPRPRDRGGDEGRRPPAPTQPRRRQVAARAAEAAAGRGPPARPRRRSSSRGASSRRSCTRSRRSASSSSSLIFILLQREDLRDRMIRLFGSSDLHRTTAAMDDAARRLSRYFLTQLALNAAFGVVIAVGLWLIGVPSPVLWGIFAGADALRALYRRLHRRRCCRSALAAAVDPGWSMALLDAGAVPRRRAAHGPRGRAAGLRPEHRPVALRGRRLGDLLDLALGADRPPPRDAADALPRRARPPRRAARVPRRAARRPAGADARPRTSTSACSPAIRTRRSSTPSSC